MVKAVRRVGALGGGRAWLGRGLRELVRVMEVFSVGTGLWFTWVNTLLKTHGTRHFRSVHLPVYKLHLKTAHTRNTATSQISGTDIYCPISQTVILPSSQIGSFLRVIII